MKALRADLALALRFARRELRSGLAGFRIFLASLTLGVAAIAGVGSLGQAFLTGLSEQGRTLLGGDVEMHRLYRPAAEDEQRFIARWGRVSESLTMRSMASEGDVRALIELKAVDNTYPLVGAATLSPAMNLQQALACEPARCGAVVESTLLARLNARVGSTIRVGSGDFIIRAELVTEPDRVAGGFTLGPRVMVSKLGIERAELVVPGSLITYSYRVAFPETEAPPTDPQIFRDHLREAFPRAGWQLADRENAIPRVTRFVRQATMFLTLIALTALVVGGVGAGQAVGAFIDRRREAIATLKAMGADGRQLFLIYLLQIMAVAALGLVAGLVIGAALPFLVQHFFGADIPAPAHYAVYAGPLVLAAVFGVLAALGFAIPPLARARDIAPAGLFRDIVAPSSVKSGWRYRAAGIGAFGTIAVLSVVLSPYPKFNLGFLGGVIVTLGLLRLAALGLRRVIRKIPHRKNQLLRLAFSNIVRPGAPATNIIVALGLGLTLLATVALMQKSVEAQVEDQLPERAPSFFFVDIQQDQIDAFGKTVAGFSTATEFTATPMLRGRIVKLKDVAADKAVVGEDVRWALNGDRGVTYAKLPPKDIAVEEGPKWWPADYQGPTLVSFDADLAHGMGLKIGDEITVNVLGRDIPARIFNLRSVDFRTGGINFVMILSPGIVDKAPHTFLATVRAAPEQEEAMFQAVTRGFPNVTVVRVKEALAQVGALLAALVHGVELASLVTIFAGVLVLAGAIAAGHQARLYEAVVLKVLGATRGRLATIYAVEYGVLGTLAGVAALGAGTLAAWAVAHFVLEIPLVFAGLAVAFTIAGGALGTLILGLAGGFAALSAKPAAKLRNP